MTHAATSVPSLLRCSSHAATFMSPLSSSSTAQRPSLPAFMEPHSCHSIHASAFTPLHSRLCMHAALMCQHSRSSINAAAFFTVLKQQHWCSCSCRGIYAAPCTPPHFGRSIHAAALKRHFHHCIKTAASSSPHLLCRSCAGALQGGGEDLVNLWRKWLFDICAILWLRPWIRAHKKLSKAEQLLDLYYYIPLFALHQSFSSTGHCELKLTKARSDLRLDKTSFFRQNAVKLTGYEPNGTHPFIVIYFAFASTT